MKKKNIFFWATKSQFWFKTSFPKLKKKKKSHFGVKNSNLRHFREQRFGFGAENVPLGHRKCGHKGTNLGLKIAIFGQKLTFKEK